ncbi:MAG: class I SAM-dependent methyltransferase [Steroidobacteraceae bacterium]
MLKLNMGCGYNRLHGFVNVDVSSTCNPDVVANLETIPWPWPADSVEAVVFNHSLEHMCAEADSFLALMRELYRVCCNEAVVQIRVPHPRHDDFMDDPTHVRIITPQMLNLFDRKKNDEWRERKCSNTPFAYYLGVDFEVTRAEVLLAEPYLTQLQTGNLTTEQVDLEVRTKNNVAKEYRIALRVRKHAAR